MSIARDGGVTGGGGAGGGYPGGGYPAGGYPSHAEPWPSLGAALRDRCLGVHAAHSISLPPSSLPGASARQGRASSQRGASSQRWMVGEHSEQVAPTPTEPRGGRGSDSGGDSGYPTEVDLPLICHELADVLAEMVSLHLPTQFPPPICQRPHFRIVPCIWIHRAGAPSFVFSPPRGMFSTLHAVATMCAWRLR